MTKPTVCPICCESFDDASAGDVDDEGDDDIESQKPRDIPASPAPPLACSHGPFCEACVLTHLKLSIEENKKIPECPAVGCREKIPRDVVEKLCGGDDGVLVSRYDRLAELQANPALVECPGCAALVEPDDEGENSSNDCRCEQCGLEFCKVHGEVHRGQTCQDFLASEKGQNFQQSERILQECTKPCSHCGALLHKTRGCDYVICANCRKDMCYRCGTHVYLSEGRFRHCTKCSGMFDGRLDLCFLELFCIGFCWGFVSLIWPVLVGAVVLITCCCFGCFCCGTYSFSRKEDRPFRPWRGFLSTLVLILFPWLVFFDEDGQGRLLDFFPEGWVPAGSYVRAPDLPIHDRGSESSETEPTTRSTTVRGGTHSSSSGTTSGL